LTFAAGVEEPLVNLSITVIILTITESLMLGTTDSTAIEEALVDLTVTVVVDPVTAHLSVLFVVRDLAKVELTIVEAD
jgi:hypothetical protein